MKKILLAALAGSTFFLSLQVHAADSTDNATGSGPYMGLALGKSRISDGYAKSQFGADSEYGNVAKIFGGYQFTPNFGLETGYASLGSASHHGIIYGTQVDEKTKNSAFYVAAVGTAPINDVFSIVGKLGASRNRTNLTVSIPASTESVNDNKTNLLIGIGADYKVYKNTTVGLEWTSYGNMATDTHKSKTLTANVRYHF